MFDVSAILWNYLYSFSEIGRDQIYEFYHYFKRGKYSSGFLDICIYVNNYTLPLLNQAMCVPFSICVRRYNLMVSMQNIKPGEYVIIRVPS